MRGGISSWLWFAFPWWWVMLSMFSCVYCPSGCLLWRNVCSCLLPSFNWIFFFLLLSCICSLCILDTSPEQIWFAITFSRLVSCIFILLVVSFAAQELCSPDSLFLLVFLSLLVSDCWKPASRPMSGSLPPVFSSRTCVDQGLTLNPFIYFELVLCAVWDSGPGSFFCMWLSGFSSSIHGRDHPFSIAYSWLLGGKWTDLRKYVDLFLGSLFCSQNNVWPKLGPWPSQVHIKWIIDGWCHCHQDLVPEPIVPTPPLRRC